MTWNDFHQRKHAIAAVLEHAGTHPEDELPFDVVPQARKIFGDADRLLCALQHTWTQALTGRIGMALVEADEDPHGDHVEAVRRAWNRTAEANPVLRRILDARARPLSDELERAFDREYRLLALSCGLADDSEPTAEIARAGAALLQLLRLPKSARATPLEGAHAPLPSS